MNLAKKITGLGAIALLSLGLAACGSDEDAGFNFRHRIGRRVSQI